jgi:hypothetical protein
MPIHTLSIGALKHITETSQRGFQRTVEFRGAARGRWIDYLREAKLNEFDSHVKEAAAGSSIAIVWPQDLNAPKLIFGIHQMYTVQGLSDLNLRISFVWREDDYSVITAQRGGDLPDVRYDFDRFLQSPLEANVVHNLAIAVNHMHSKLLPAPPER